MEEWDDQFTNLIWKIFSNFTLILFSLYPSSLSFSHYVSLFVFLSVSPSKSKKNGHLKRKGYFLPVGKLHLKRWGFITCCRWSFHPFTLHHDFSPLFNSFFLSLPPQSLSHHFNSPPSHTHSLLIPYYCNDVSSSFFTKLLMTLRE